MAVSKRWCEESSQSNTTSMQVDYLNWILFLVCVSKMSCVVRKPAFGICENKDADQFRGIREADQRL